ncbi:MAG: hypothetical protein NTW69_13655 [Chloroflexi bacterium]|nr:hypothetical protein [Chloroflexota bacterium]
MKSKISENEILLALWKYDSREDALARFLSCNIKAIPLIYGGYERMDGNLLDLVSQHPADMVKIAKHKKFNVGVELGPQSGNLFIINFFSKADYTDFSRSSHGLDKWVSTEGSNYHVWLYLEDGTAQGIQTSTYAIQTQGIILAPPSSSPDGDICSWIKRKGMHPPIVNHEEIKIIFPQLIIQTKHISQTQDLRIFIKNELIRQLIISALSMSWPGQGGLSLLKVIIACFRRADLEQINDFRAALSEISLLASMSKKTARKVLKELVRMGVLFYVKTNSFSDHYGINLKFFEANMVSSEIANMVLPILNHDLFSRTALNPSSAQILCSLLLRPRRTLKDISDETGRGYSTVKKSIQIMEKEGLVEKKNGVWIVLPCDKKKLDGLAKSYGVDGKYQKKKAKYRLATRRFVAFRTRKALYNLS